MTTVRRLLLSLLMGLLLAIPTTAESAEMADRGWWWRPQTGLLGAELPPPPDVPADGLVVERAPDGPTAISALRFVLAEGESAPVLTLHPASFEGGDAAIAACQTRTRWHGEQAGTWARAPGVDCEAGLVDGVRNEDGTWTWELAGLVRDGGVVDVALVGATTAPFRIVFGAPGEDAVQVTSSPPPPPPPPSSQEVGSTSTPASTVAPAPQPVLAPPPAPAPPEVAPEVAAPTQAGPDAPSVAPALPATADPGPSPLAWAMLALVAALVAVELAAAVRGRGDTAAAWQRERSGVGGIGRFSRQRDQAPTPLR